MEVGEEWSNGSNVSRTELLIAVQSTERQVLEYGSGKGPAISLTG